VIQYPAPLPPQPAQSLWNSAVAWLFGVPVAFAGVVPASHWLAHARVAAFAFFVSAPIACAAWTHVFALLLGPSTLWLVNGALGLFMAGAVILLDSQVAGTLARKELTTLDAVLIAVRATFIVCLGAATAIAALLWMLGPQLARERADEELSAYERDRVRVRELHKLPELELATAKAANSLETASAELSATPPAVSSLRERSDLCVVEFRRLEEEASRALPTLIGKRERLRTTSQAVERAVGAPSALENRATVNGSLREVEVEIGEASRRVARHKAECRELQEQINVAAKLHTQRAREMHTAATSAHEAALRAETAARSAADTQLEQLREISGHAWGENLAGVLAALGSLLSKYWWPRLVGIGVAAMVMLTESAVMLGKLRLRGGPLDRLVEVEEEHFSQSTETRLVGARLNGEVERAVLLKGQKTILEIAAARKVAETAIDHAEILRRRRDAAASSPDLKDLADDVFSTARSKIRGIVHRALTTGGSASG
jgi:hypothetical protein